MLIVRLGTINEIEESLKNNTKIIELLNQKNKSIKFVLIQDSLKFKEYLLYKYDGLTKSISGDQLKLKELTIKDINKNREELTKEIIKEINKTYNEIFKEYCGEKSNEKIKLEENIHFKIYLDPNDTYNKYLVHIKQQIKNNDITQADILTYLFPNETSELCNLSNEIHIKEIKNINKIKMSGLDNTTLDISNSKLNSIGGGYNQILSLGFYNSYIGMLCSNNTTINQYQLQSGTGKHEQFVKELNENIYEVFNQIKYYNNLNETDQKYIKNSFLYYLNKLKLDNIVAYEVFSTLLIEPNKYKDYEFYQKYPLELWEDILNEFKKLKSSIEL